MKRDNHLLIQQFTELAVPSELLIRHRFNFKKPPRAAGQPETCEFVITFQATEMQIESWIMQLLLHRALSPPW